MVAFALTDAQERWQAETRAFARDELVPTAAGREREHAIPRALMQKLAERGLLGVTVPKDLGGAAAGAIAYALALREVAAADASVAVTMAVTNMVAEVLCRFGSAEQARAWVPRLTSGEQLAGAFALSEPGAGSDSGSLATRAEPAPGGYRLNGQKAWITSGDGAGVLVVWARTGESGTRGLSCFVVPGDAAGLSAGKPEEKLGLRASHTVALALEDVHVPEANLLGELGRGFGIAMAALEGGRIGIAAQACGLTQALLEQAVAHRQPAPALADLATELDAGWLLTLRAAWLKEQGRPFTQEAAMAKLYASEAANNAARAVMRLLGPQGYMEEGPVARLWRDCRVTQIYEGTSEIQRLVIGRALVKES